MYLNVIELAESFGVEENVVEGWVRNEALPAIEDRGRLVFNRAHAVDWAASRGLVAKAGLLAPAQTVSSPSRLLEQFLRASRIHRDLPASKILNTFEHVLTGLPGTTPAVRQIFTQGLRAPGGITWAPGGGGVALPHLRSHVALGCHYGLLAGLLLRDPMPDAEAPTDGIPVMRLLFFMAPPPRSHLEMLAQFCGAPTRFGLHNVLLRGAKNADIFNGLADAETSLGKGGQK